MAKIHSNSTYAKLKRADMLDEFYGWYYNQHPGYREIADWLEERGMPHSDGAIFTLLRVHSIYWKVEAAERRAAATDAALPEQTDEMIRRQLKQKEFDLAFADLSTQEALSVLRYDLDKKSAAFAGELEKAKFELKKEAEARAREALRLQREKFQRETCELFVKWAQDKRAKQIANSKGIGSQEKVEKLGKLIFKEDW